MLLKSVYEILGVLAISGPADRPHVCCNPYTQKHYRQDLLIAITPFCSATSLGVFTYFLNLNGPGFGPFGVSVGLPFPPVSPFSFEEGVVVFTEEGGGGSGGRVKVMTVPRGFPPRGTAPNLNGPSGIGSDCGGAVDLPGAGGAFLSVVAAGGSVEGLVFVAKF